MKSKAEKFFERSEVSFDSRINYDARTLAAKLTLKRHGRPLMPKGGPNYPYSATFRISWDQGPHTNEEYLEWSRQDYRFTDQTDFSYLTDRMTRYAENFSHELGVEIGEAPHAVDFYS